MPQTSQMPNPQDSTHKQGARLWALPRKAFSFLRALLGKAFSFLRVLPRKAFSFLWAFGGKALSFFSTSIWRGVLAANPWGLCLLPIALAIALAFAAFYVDFGLPTIGVRILIGPLASLMLAHAVVFGWMFDTVHPICPYKNREILGFHKVFCLSLGCMSAGVISELFGSSLSLACLAAEAFLLEKMYWEYYCVDHNIPEMLTKHLDKDIRKKTAENPAEKQKLMTDCVIGHFSRITDTAINNIRSKPASELAKSCVETLREAGKSIEEYKDDVKDASFNPRFMWMRVGERCIFRDPSPQEIEGLSLLSFANSLCEQLFDAAPVVIYDEQQDKQEKERQLLRNMEQALCVTAGVISTLTRWTSSMLTDDTRVEMRYRALVQLFFHGIDIYYEQGGQDVAAKAPELASSALFLWLLSDYVAEYNIAFSGTQKQTIQGQAPQTLLRGVLMDEHFREDSSSRSDLKEQALQKCQYMFRIWKGLPPLREYGQSDFVPQAEEMFQQTCERAHYGELSTHSFEKENIANIQLDWLDAILSETSCKPDRDAYAPLTRNEVNG